MLSRVRIEVQVHTSMVDFPIDTTWSHTVTLPAVTVTLPADDWNHWQVGGDTQLDWSQLPSGHYYLAEIHFFSKIQNLKVKKLLLDRVLWVCYWSRTISILRELSEYGTKSLRGVF